MGEERQFSTASGIPATNQPVWKWQNWCQTRTKTLKSHQHSMQNDTEQSPPLSQCRAGFSAESEFSHSRLCLPRSHSLSSAFIWFLRFFSLPFCQTSGFRNASRESIKGRQHCGYLRAVLEGRAFFPRIFQDFLWRKCTGHTLTGCPRWWIVFHVATSADRNCNA